MPKARRWYYERDGEKRGPFLGREIRRMVRTGEILPADLIWKEGMQEWVTAGSVPKLFKRIGNQRRSAPSLMHLSVAGLLAVIAAIVSPLGDLTSGLKGMPYTVSTAFCGACLAGAIVTFLLALIGKEQEPMIVPTEGRLLRDSEADADSPQVDDEALPEVKAPAGRVILPNLFSWARNLRLPLGGKNLAPTRVILGVLALLATGWVVMQLLSREPRGSVVAGKVTFQGKPVRVGSIKFTPHGQDESAMPLFAGEIRNGRYALSSGHGCDGGRFTVQIVGFTGIPKKVGATTDPLGDQLFPRVTRTVELKCPNLSLDLTCDSD
jgi:hypothetical protein